MLLGDVRQCQLSYPDAFIVGAQLPMEIELRTRLQFFLYESCQERILEYASAEGKPADAMMLTDLHDGVCQRIEYF